MARRLLLIGILLALPRAAAADAGDISASAPFQLPGMKPERAARLELMLGHMSSSPNDLTLLGLQVGAEYPLTQRLGLEFAPRF